MSDSDSDSELDPDFEPPRRRWRWLLGVGVVLVAVVAIFLIARAPSGGPTDSPLGRVMSQGIPGWVIALDDWVPASKGREGSGQVHNLRAELDAARAAALDEGAWTEAAASPRAALAALLDTAETLAGSVPEGEGWTDGFHEAMASLNRSLDAAGLPWFIDGDALPDRGRDRTQVGLFVFHVDGRADFGVPAAEPVRALRLTRVDALNWEQPVLGYTRPGLGAAVVLRGAVESLLVSYLGPALVEGGGMPLLDFESRDMDSEWQDEVRARAGEVAREAWAAELPSDVQALADIGARLEERRVHFITWRVELRGKGLILPVPETLELDERLYTILEPVVADFELRELRAAQAALEEGPLRAVFERMVDVQARTIERHEVQHVLDYRRGDDFPVPQALEEATGMARGEDGKLPRALERANYEASAYLSQIARAGALARVDLTMLMRHLLHRGSGGSAEWYAALVITEGLAERLGLEGSIVRRGRVRRTRVGKRYLELMKVPSVDLEEAAAGLWESWYGRPLDTLARTELVAQRP